jgi:hypothetical protein
MQDINLNCWGISNVDVQSGPWLNVGLWGVDLDFLSELKPLDVLKGFGDNEKLLAEMDVDEIKAFLEGLE